MQLGLSRFLSVRLGASAELTALRERQVAARDPTRYLAFVLLFVFLLATASGILLLVEYWPGPDRAHDSIVNIMGRVPFGDLVRGVHVWSSQLLVAGLILQVILYVATRRYAAPRELVWLSLLALLALAVGLAFTGSILPWTQGAYLQARVSSDLASHTPLVGDFLGRLLRGGREVDSWTLHHAFAFHVGYRDRTREIHHREGRRSTRLRRPSRLQHMPACIAGPSGRYPTNPAPGIAYPSIPISWCAWQPPACSCSARPSPWRPS